MDKNKRKSFDRNSKILSSNEVPSEINLKSMFAKLEYNHRRLLGVTSALTEALENTVRGSSFELEETLNKCMEIYPELFTLNIRKPSKNTNFKKMYNTSVSEDITDTAESGKKRYSSFQIQSDSDQSIKNIETNSKTPSFTFDKETQRKYYSTPESRQPMAFTNPEHLNMKNVTSVAESISIQPTKHSNIPKIYKEPSFEILLNPNEDYQETTNDNIGSNINPNHLSAHPSPSPDFKNYSFSSRLSGDESSVFISPVAEKEFNLDNTNTYVNQTPITEASYTVKHPESDTDYSTHSKDYTYNQYDNNSIMEDSKNPFGLNGIHLPLEHNDQHDSNEDKHSNWPYEIIVQQKGREEEDPNTGLSIKIIPEARTSNERCTFTTQSERPYQHTENQNPVETHIIIKKQFSPNYNNNSNNNDEFIFNSPTEKISVTIAKLQSLSTGLRVQSGVLRPNQIEVSHQQGYRSEIGKVASSSEHPTKIALINSYSINNSPKVKDEAFEEIKNDFISIKSNLIEGTVMQRSQILQSLRLNLIHTLAKERSSLLESYIENDIFDIHCNSSLLESLMPKEIINGWDLILQQTVLKFLNTLSSMWKGRDYLTTNLKTLNCLQKYFFDKYSMRVSSEMICKDMLVATFHKLSTRKSQQMSLINAGVSEKILFGVLENQGSISAYRLLHSLGLLINLCVNSQGAQQMEPMSQELLTLLVTLLQSKETKIVPNAARLLYILMGNDKFHKEAKNMDILKILEECIKVSNKRMKLHMETLKSAIEQTKAHNHLNNAEETYLKNIEIEIDELEEEVEVGEPGVTNTQSESYKKSALGAKTDLKIKEKLKPPQEYASKEDELKHMTSQSSSNLGMKSAKDNNNAVEDKKSMETKSESSQIEENRKLEENKKFEENKKLEEKEKNKKLEEKEKNKKSEEKGKKGKSKKKRDRDTDSLLSSNYALLKEALDNIIDDQANYNIIPETASEEFNSHSENLKHDENENVFSKDISNLQEGHHGEVKEKDHAVTSEQDSSKEQIKTIKEEIKSPEEEMKNIKEEINTTTAASSNEEKEDHATPLASKKEFAVSKSRPPSQKSEHLTQRSRKHSLYSQDGNNDYDYCEDTKQIQVPVQHHNIFSDSRQSPYKGLFTDTNRDVTPNKTPEPPPLKEKETGEVAPDSPKNNENKEVEKN